MTALLITALLLAVLARLFARWRESGRSIARSYGASDSVVSYIKLGKTYQEVQA